MKKRLLAMFIACLGIFVACGSKPSDNNSSNTAVQSQSQSGESSNEEGTGSAPEITEGYHFESSGVKIIPDMEAKELIDALGEPISYFEANSCAFGDQDKRWTYSGFEIDTYQLEGVDYIYDVVLTADTVETPEGIYLGKTRDDVIKAYGKAKEETDTLLLYQKGEMKLLFILEGDKIISIEYDSMVLDKQ